MRVYNFAAGPSTLPLNVLEKAQAEFLDLRERVCRSAKFPTATRLTRQS